MRRIGRILFSRYTVSASVIILEVFGIIYLLLRASTYSYIAFVLAMAVDVLMLFAVINMDANPEYKASEYWRGPTWLNTASFAATGLKNYGYIELAEKIKNNVLEVCANEKEIIFEYYDSITGKGLGAKQFAWSAAFIIEFIVNF